MRKMVWVAVMVACYYGMLSAAKPMEALERYNVVLVHGAAPENQGFGNLCDGGVNSAWEFHNNWVADYTTQEGKREAPKSLGEAAGMLGAYNQDGDAKLTLWLDSAVFEDTVTYGSEHIYIQRSFTNPAESPAHNAHEIGDRTWKGNNKCSIRRSLFEESQEVRADGQTNLRTLRNSSNDLYRVIPSRNILIAHSMGGVASHEYVTDQSVYNNDVDKVITLDSPHEGTGSLNMLLDMRWSNYLDNNALEGLTTSGFAIFLRHPGGRRPIGSSNTILDLSSSERSVVDPYICFFVILNPKGEGSSDVLVDRICLVESGYVIVQAHHSAGIKYESTSGLPLDSLACRCDPRRGKAIYSV